MEDKSAIDRAFEAGKASALAEMVRSDKPILMVDEMDLSELEFANARGWNSVCVSPENKKRWNSLNAART